MDPTHLYQQFVTEFNLEQIPEEDREEILLEISKTIQKQFLLDVYDTLGEEKFAALQASASMGPEFYATTMKHLLPNYEELFERAREKVKSAFQKK